MRCRRLHARRRRDQERGVQPDEGALRWRIQVLAIDRPRPVHALDEGLQRVWLVGGGDVAAQFLAAGLVHELMLATMPVTLGRGIGLFGGNTGNTLPHWTVVASQSHANGVLTRHYRQAGPASASR